MLQKSNENVKNRCADGLTPNPHEEKYCDRFTRSNADMWRGSARRLSIYCCWRINKASKVERRLSTGVQSKWTNDVKDRRIRFAQVFRQNICNKKIRIHSVKLSESKNTTYTDARLIITLGMQLIASGNYFLTSKGSEVSRTSLGKFRASAFRWNAHTLAETREAMSFIIGRGGGGRSG